MSHTTTEIQPLRARRRGRVHSAIWVVVAAALLAPGTLFAQFRRGDVDVNGRMTVRDVCALNNFLFSGGVLPCADAADVNDDGAVNIQDAVNLVNFLCTPGVAPPPAPGPMVCGLDPTPDLLPPCVYPVCAFATLPPNSRFIRGDCDLSLTISIADTIASLNKLFGVSVQGPCMSACDSNADGLFNLADPLYTLGYLFAGGPPPPAPFPNCGCDGTCPATTTCESGPCP